MAFWKVKDNLLHQQMPLLLICLLRLSNTFSFWVFTEPVPSLSCMPLID